MDWENIINVFETPIELGPPVRKAEHYQSGSSKENSHTMGAKRFVCDIRVIPPKKMAVPYHFHYDNEELFLILDGEATLRQNNKRRIVKKGDLIYFKTGPEGAHQLFNHSDSPVRYLDLVASGKGDICEYPDSEKVNCGSIYRKTTQVDYFDGEETPSPFWNELQRNSEQGASPDADKPRR